MFFKKKPQLFTDKLTGYYHSEHYPYHLSFKGTKESWYKSPLMLEQHKKTNMRDMGEIDMVFCASSKNKGEGFDAVGFIYIFKSVFEDGVFYFFKDKRLEALRTFYRMFFDSYSDHRFNEMMSDLAEENGIEITKEVYNRIRTGEKDALLERMITIIRSSYFDNWVFNTSKIVDNNSSSFEIVGRVPSNDTYLETYDFLIPMQKDMIWFRGVANDKTNPNAIEDIKHIAHSIKPD